MFNIFKQKVNVVIFKYQILIFSKNTSYFQMFNFKLSKTILVTYTFTFLCFISFYIYIVVCLYSWNFIQICISYLCFYFHIHHYIHHYIIEWRLPSAKKFSSLAERVRRFSPKIRTKCKHRRAREPS